ncbi:FecR family protein [Chitinophaga sp. Cy-1792]|uniref:FecR family protein n=1 Tax=Chitinophaga sp. Cy-1792 TaxID=2608339 RepID=UPI00141F799B|nr:FecR domain-containing protein [Chitinophaga sp. Cy-1792]NIG55395.1 FecR family protein [Chitinophaga sp. Cy-1792]
MKDNIYQLIDKYLDGTISPAEEARLMAWYQEHSEADVEWFSEHIDEEERVRLRMLGQIQQHISTPAPVTVVHKQRWHYWAAAAAVLLVAGLATWLYMPPLQHSPKQAPLAQAPKAITPGGNKAVLILGNGEKIVLEDAGNGLLSQEGSVAVNKTDSGSLQYNGTRQAAGTVYNTLNTPYGGQYRIILQDGTKVWLNAGSSLHYPTSFPEGERSVTLSGEAYFEVAPDASRPFTVAVATTAEKTMNVRVLGTHFNINAYPEEKQNLVTLLEGSVKVAYDQANALLVPGKVAMLNKASGSIQTKNADTEAAIAWKNGYFVFDNENIAGVMRQISRWYDVDVRYEGNVSGKAIAGSLSRTKDVTAVLSMLELTGTVHFKIEGRRITVMP